MDLKLVIALLFLVLIFGGMIAVIVLNVRAARQSDWSAGWLFKFVVVVATAVAWDICRDLADARQPLGWIPVMLAAATLAAVAARFAWRVTPGSIASESLTWICVGSGFAAWAVLPSGFEFWPLAAWSGVYGAVVLLVSWARPHAFTHGPFAQGRWSRNARRPRS